MSMNWLPTLQKVFNVIPALACNNVTQPYWEQQYVYPLENMTPATNTTNATAILITNNTHWDFSSLTNASTVAAGAASSVATSTTIILSPVAAATPAA
jgi:hypothetical protein